MHPPPRRAPAAAVDSLLIIAAILVACMLIGPARAIGLHIPLNYNEGWNAYLAVRAMSPAAGPLYPPPGSLVFNNYPPLSFYLVGALGRYVFADMIVAGRVVALASFLASGGLLSLVVHRLGAGGRASIAAGLLLLLFACTFFRDYVAMDDPQWLGHAFMLAGLAVLLKAPVLPARTVIGAALLVLLGGLVKHNLVALPLSLTIWLTLKDRRAAAVWLATAIIGLALAASACWALYGPAIFSDVLHHPRTLQPSGILKGAGRLLPLLPMAVLSALLLRPDRQHPAIVFVGLFAAVACATGLAQRAGAGVAINAQFETLIAVCLAAGLALDRVRARRGAMLALMAVPVLVVLPRRLPNAWADLAQAQPRAQAWQPIIARLAAAPGPVACETLALCYWAGKPFAVDLFNLTQSVLARGQSPAFQQMLAQHAVGAFELVPRSPIHQRRDPLLNQIEASYTPAVAGPQGSVVMVPR